MFYLISFPSVYNKYRHCFILKNSYCWLSQVLFSVSLVVFLLATLPFLFLFFEARPMLCILGQPELYLSASASQVLGLQGYAITPSCLSFLMIRHFCQTFKINNSFLHVFVYMSVCVCMGASICVGVSAYVCGGWKLTVNAMNINGMKIFSISMVFTQSGSLLWNMEFERSNSGQATQPACSRNLLSLPTGSGTVDDCHTCLAFTRFWGSSSLHTKCFIH